MPKQCSMGARWAGKVEPRAPKGRPPGQDLLDQGAARAGQARHEDGLQLPAAATSSGAIVALAVRALRCWTPCSRELAQLALEPGRAASSRLLQRRRSLGFGRLRRLGGLWRLHACLGCCCCCCCIAAVNLHILGKAGSSSCSLGRIAASLAGWREQSAHFGQAAAVILLGVVGSVRQEVQALGLVKCGPGLGVAPGRRGRRGKRVSKGLPKSPGCAEGVEKADQGRMRSVWPRCERAPACAPL